MTEPTEPAQDQQRPRTPLPPPEEEEADSLVPLIAMIVAAYLGFRAVTNRAELTRDQLLRPLAVDATMTFALQQAAMRVLAWQRAQNGRAGDELVPYVSDGVRAAVLAGIEVVEDTLVYWDKDGRLDDMQYRPTAVSMLARNVARALSNAAVEAAAQGAGWRFKTWLTQGDARVRSLHRPMHGQRRPMGEKFADGAGNQLDFPGDPSAPPDTWSNCRCFLTIER